MFTTDPVLQTTVPQVGSKVSVWTEPNRMFVARVEQTTSERLTVRRLDGEGTVSVNPAYVRTME